MGMYARRNDSVVESADAGSVRESYRPEGGESVHAATTRDESPALFLRNHDGFPATSGCRRSSLADRHRIAMDTHPHPGANPCRLILQVPLARMSPRTDRSRLRPIGSTVVAVRSSATAEDLPGHSFAGQYETILGVSRSKSVSMRSSGAGLRCGPSGHTSTAGGTASTISKSRWP